MSKIKSLMEIKKSLRFRLSIPFLPVEIDLNDIANTSTVDERIAKLGQIQTDLKAAIDAVDILKSEAETKKVEAEQLRGTVEQLKQEKETAQTLLNLPEDALTRLLIKAGSKGRLRGIIEGIMIGLITGGLSSYIIWYLTK